MKEGWSNCKIGDICSITDFVSNGSFASLKENVKYYNSPNYAVLVRLADASNGFDRSKFVYTDEHGYDFSKKSHLHGGELIMSNVGSVGSMFICPVMKQPMTLAPNTISITSQNNRFLYYYFLSDGFKAKLKGITSSTTLKKFNKTNFKLLEICIPSLSEQQSIVDYLDLAFAKIDAMKANAEKALNEAKALFQASLKEMLEPKEGWEEKKLKEICETITDFVAAGSFASLRENVVYKSEKDYAQLVRTTDLKSGFSKGSYVYVNEHAFEYLYRVNLDKECIILPNVGVNCGEVYYVTPSLLPYNNNVLGPNAVLVRSNKYNNHFLSYLFLGKDFQKKLSDITSHMAQPKFNKTGLKEIVISVPLLSEQQSIVETLDSLKSKVDRLQENYEKISQECDALKQAILRQVFE